MEDKEENPELPPAQEVVWTASEFVAHEKSVVWYMALTLAAAAVVGIVYFVSRDKLSVGVVVLGSLMLGIYAARQPRQLEYRLNAGGLSIGQRHYAYDEFRSFAVVPEGAFLSIVFMPLKRFGTPTTIYFPPEEEEKIMAMLSNRLPFEEHTPDAVDRLVRRIRF